MKLKKIKYQDATFLVVPEAKIEKEDYFLTIGFSPVKGKSGVEVQKCKKPADDEGKIMSYEQSFADPIIPHYFTFSEDRSVRVVGVDRDMTSRDLSDVPRIPDGLMKLLDDMEEHELETEADDG